MAEIKTMQEKNMGDVTSRQRVSQVVAKILIYLFLAVMAVIVFVALFFFKAGYGYLSTSNWGPKIGNKVAWVLMEAPAFVFLLMQNWGPGVRVCVCVHV